MPKATLGRTVIVHGIDSNGALDHPATITRVWSDRDTRDGPVMVNLAVFPDCAAPCAQGSVMLYDTAEQAQAERAGRMGVITAYWPERIEIGGPAVEMTWREAPAPAEMACAAANTPRSSMDTKVTDEMVARFLAWSLPGDVCVDPCAMALDYPGRTGTILLNAAQARQMLEHVLAHVTPSDDFAARHEAPLEIPPDCPSSDAAYAIALELLQRLDKLSVSSAGFVLDQAKGLLSGLTRLDCSTTLFARAVQVFGPARNG